MTAHLLSSVLALRRMCPIYTTLPRSHFSLATDVRDLWVNIHTGFDQDYGKSLVFSSDPYPFIGLLQKLFALFSLPVVGSAPDDVAGFLEASIFGFSTFCNSVPPLLE
jgi:hypothetical protein